LKDAADRFISKAKAKKKKTKPKKSKKSVLTPYQKQSRDFLKSRAWREVRYKALLLHGKKCQCCGAKPPSIILHVDHIKCRYQFPKLKLEISNLQILCEACNIGKGAWDSTDHR